MLLVSYFKSNKQYLESVDQYLLLSRNYGNYDMARTQLKL